MKNVLYMALVIIAFSFVGLIAQPKIEIVGGDTYDWGDIKGETILKAKVKIRNAGKDLLKIEEVKPTCGCTTAPLDRNELKAGEIATLDVTLNVAGRSNQVTKNIRIKSNDPSANEKVLWLKCNVIKDLFISNTYLSFQDMTIGYDKESRITITNNSKSSIKLSDFEVDNPDLKINLRGNVEVKPGKSVDLIAVATPKASGNFRGVVKFKTSDPDNKNVTINAFGRVKDSPIFNNPGQSQSGGGNKK